jgi:cbb3-type cytochrome oxidase cytochrome c subunit
MRALFGAVAAGVFGVSLLAAGAASASEITYFVTDSPEFRASAKFGKQMFVAYQCAKCHATREDQPLNEDIVAPNLLLTKERLRPEWILQWMIDPQALQANTKMPNFFSFNEDDDGNPIYTDADAHVQYKIIVALRDYLMIMGTPADAQLD